MAWTDEYECPSCGKTLDPLQMCSCNTKRNASKMLSEITDAELNRRILNRTHYTPTHNYMKPTREQRLEGRLRELEERIKKLEGKSKQRKTNMKTISKEEYYKVVGLLSIAKDHMNQLKTIERSLADVVDEQEDENCDEYYGHVSDAVYSDYSAKYLLDRLKIKVEPEEEE